MQTGDETIDTIIGVGTAVVTVASVITGFTGTPKPNSFWGRVYKIIEILGFVTETAKQRGDNRR